MLHMGDITKLDGRTLPVVDVITGGSPCQDLSVAGNRAGLSGERSGLFMEQIRIVKEMREHDRNNGRPDHLVRARYMVWENVPGAFSSNGGRDFQAVLTETVRVADPEAPDVPLPDKGGWPGAGCLYDGDMGSWSVAWRVHDAQFWGVPQRRKRICLLADFDGLTAPEILFDPQLERTTDDGEPISLDRHSGHECGPEVQTERESLSRDSEPGGASREGAASAVGDCPAYSIQGNTVDREAHQNGFGISTNVAHTLNAVDRHVVCFPKIANTLPARMDGSPCIDRGPPIVACLNPWDPQSKRIFDPEGAAPTLSSGTAEGKNIVPSILLVYDARGNGDGLICPTITGDHQNRITDYTALCVGNGQINQMSMSEQANALDTMHDQQAVMICSNGEIAPSLVASAFKGMENTQDGMAVCIAYAPETAKVLHAKANLQHREDSETYIVAAVNCRNGKINPDVNGTLQAKEQGQNLNSNNVIIVWPEVRRLTPLECERLQGYPDGWTDIGDWTDGKGRTRREADTPRFKALGNSVALPYWEWLARRICAKYERPVTLGSLFSGIGGFELAFSRAGATPVWASEIEEFPIAVTKRHFPEEADDDRTV